MNKEPTKAQKRKLRELAALAHEHELTHELELLEAEFGRWRKGEIGPFELNDRIHAFHDRRARELFKKYVSAKETWAVGGALALGVLSEDEVGPELLAIVGPKAEFVKKYCKE